MYEIIFGVSCGTHCFCNFFLKFTWNNSEWIIKNVKHWSSPVFQVLFGFVLICFIAFAVYHYRQKLPVVQSALSNYHPGWSPKPLLSRATLRNDWLCHLWHRLWRFSHIEKLQSSVTHSSACYSLQIELTFESQSKLISPLWWIPSRITLSTAVQTINLIKRLFHLWFTEVMWSIFK